MIIRMATGIREKAPLSESVDGEQGELSGDRIHAGIGPPEGTMTIDNHYLFCPCGTDTR